MGAIKSVLKEVVDAFPKKQTIKGSNVEAMLKKKGVKQDELSFAKLGIDDAARYDDEGLKKLETNRADTLETVEQDRTQFDWVSLHDEATNPTYKEKVITFKQDGQSLPGTAKDSEEIARLYREEGEKPAKEYARTLGYQDDDDLMRFMGELQDRRRSSRYTSEHFTGQENYLMHTRTFDDTLDGAPTRVLQEVQSDLHQQGRKIGYGIRRVPLTDEETRILGEPGADQEAFMGVIADHANGANVDDIFEFADELLAGKSSIPESPYQKTWLRKGIERELVDAMNEGRQQLAIPIKGSLGKLQRGAGVQKWYETQVFDTARKVAKASGADFEVKRVGSGEVEAVFEPKEITQLGDFFNNLEGAPNKDDLLDEFLQSPRIISNPEATAITNQVKAGQLAPFDAFKKLVALKQKSGIEYAVIKPTEKTLRQDFSLYSTPVAGAFAGYMALKQGASEEELSAYLANQGNDEEEIAETVDKAKQIQAAIAQGATEEEVKAYLMGQQPQEQKVETLDTISATRAEEILASKDNNPSAFVVPPELVEDAKEQYQAELVQFKKETSLPSFLHPAEELSDEYAEQRVMKNLNSKVDAYNVLVSNKEMDLVDFVAKLETVYPNMVSIADRTIAWAGNGEAMQTAKQAELASRLRIIKQAEKLGVSLEYVGEHGLTDDAAPRPDIGVVTDEGRWMAVMPDGTKVDADPGFWASIQAEGGEISSAIAGGIFGAKVGAKVPGGAKVKLAGGLIGSMMGAAGAASIGSQADYMVNAIQIQQDLNASIAGARARDAAQASALGDAIAFPAFKALGFVGKGTAGLYRKIKNGDLMGANQALKEMMALSDDEAAAIVQQAERVMSMDGSQSSKEISSFITTQPGGEAIMNVVGTIDTTAKRIVSLDIDKRAKDLIKTSGELVPDRIDKVLSKDLDNYVTDVKSFYGDIKAQAANTPDANKWSFDYAKLGIDPVLDAMQTKIDDVPTLERFMLKAQRIRERVDGRTFADLLDLRQMVNGFIYGRGTKKATELTAFRELVSKIDESIKQGSDIVMENPKEWRSNWALARKQYADMKGVEKNVLYKSLTAPGVDDTIAVKKMVRYITSGDETWTDVMAKLPAKTQASSENAVVDALVNKFSQGEGFQAINYPKLSEELGRTTFATPEARKLKEAISRLGDVFKNDIPLLDQSGGLTIPHASQGLTTDLQEKAHYSLMSSVWTRMQQFIPGKAGRKAALITKAADLLENPLNVKTAKELMDEVGPSVNLAPKVLELQREAALEAAKSHSATVKLYGKGKVLSPKGSGKETKIHVSRIATPDVAAQVAEAEGIAQSNIKALEFALKQRGYQAIVQGTEKVKLL